MVASDSRRLYTAFTRAAEVQADTRPEAGILRDQAILHENSSPYQDIIHHFAIHAAQSHAMEPFRDSNMLVAPVEDSSKAQYPEDMSTDKVHAETIQDGGDDDDRGSDDEIIERGKQYSPQEMQTGLTVFTAAVFITGEMAGSGVLALPAAIVGAGWTGFGLLVLCCFASGYCGMVAGEILGDSPRKT